MNMKTRLDKFLKKNNVLPEMYYYMTFLEAARPILFVCKDEKENVFICSCHCAKASKCEWIVAPTTYNRLIELLTDKITIRDIFTIDNDDLYIVTVTRDSGQSILKVSVADIDDTILPTAGYYMDAEDDEFTEELEELNTKLAIREEFNSITFCGVYRTVIERFKLEISTQASKIIARPDASFNFQNHTELRDYVRYVV